MVPTAQISLVQGIADPVLQAEVTIALLAVCGGLLMLALNRHWALLKMRKAERSFRDLYNNIGDGVFRSTLDGRMISANPALVRLNGFTNEAEMLDAVNDIAGKWYVEPGRRAELHAILLREGRVSGFVSEVYRYKTRERIWIEESTRLVRHRRTGEPLYYDGTIREVTETIRRLELQERYDKVATIVSGCLYQVRLKPDGTFVLPFVSRSVTSLYGITPEEAMEDPTRLAKLIHPDDRAAVTESFIRSARTLTPRQSEYRIRTPAGVEKWVFGQSVPEREADGSILWHGFFTDVSERKRSEARIYELAFFDPLTRLPNRTMLLDGLRAALSASEQSGEWGALLFIDLDQFKLLNDTKGHHIGDRLLVEVATRLRLHVGETDLIARLGGDEFVVTLQNLGPDEAGATEKVRRLGSEILAGIAEPFALDSFPFQTTASIGAATFRGSRTGVDDLLKRADLAMYEAKATRGGSLRFFKAELLQIVEQRLALTTELRDALDRGGLSLVYQPQVDADGTCFAAEALLRWNHPERGIILPNDFLPLAEPNGLAGAIDSFVLRTAAATLRRWEGDPLTGDLLLAVNISALQLGRKGFAATVKNALAEAGADPARLILELTEHVMLENVDEVSAVMNELKALGVRFALDDFGTGYSSLSYLKRLPIDTLKIDRSFVSDLETDPSDRAIVQTILNIARNLEVSVIAEGVETEMQAILLRQLGCYAFQGYLYAHPLALEAFEIILPAMRRGGKPRLLQATA